MLLLTDIFKPISCLICTSHMQSYLVCKNCLQDPICNGHLLPFVHVEPHSSVTMPDACLAYSPSLKSVTVIYCPVSTLTDTRLKAVSFGCLKSSHNWQEKPPACCD